MNVDCFTTKYFLRVSILRNSNQPHNEFPHTSPFFHSSDKLKNVLEFIIKPSVLGHLLRFETVLCLIEFFIDGNCIGRIKRDKCHKSGSMEGVDS
jgi:hypothetical protein